VVVTEAQPATGPGYRGQRGQASWYGSDFQGSPTASGEPFNMNALTAAHRTLPLGSYARVKNLDNGRSVVVRINDRGPHARRRTIDLSYAAAREIEMVGAGTAPVEVAPL
jgi:rare lipoprotein A